MTTVTDVFNRADNTALGSDWAEDAGTWQITSNTLRQTTTGGAYYKCRWTGTGLASSDNFAEIDGRGTSSAIGFGAFVRGATSATVTYYAQMVFPGDSDYLAEITAGGESLIDTGSARSTSTTYTVRIEATGTSLVGKIDGVSSTSATDASLSTGAVGIAVYGSLDNTNDWADNFDAGDLGGATYSETAGALEAWTASAADTRAGVDTSAAILGLVAASSDTRAAVDTGAATLGLTASAADTFSQSDTTAALLGWVASSGDTGAGADTTTAALGWLAAGADTFAQTDTTEAILGWVASGADTFDGGATAYNETAGALLGWAASVSDTFTHSDTAAAELDFSAAASETFAGFDTASPVIEWTVSASDSTASIDSVMALLGWTASVSDSTVSPDPSRIIVDVFQAGRQVAQANKAVGQKIRKVSG